MDQYATRRVVAGLVLLAALGFWLAPWASRDTVVVRPERPPARGPASNQFSQVMPASPQQIEQVTRFLTGGVRLRDPRVLASWREERSYYFGARVSGARGTERIGIWLVGGTKTNPGMVISVNAAADAVSSAPWGPDTGTSIYDREPDILLKYYE
jgi:hypothetical protein